MRKFSLIASMLLIAYTASAQFMNAENSESSDNDFYNRIEISYNPISVDGKFIDSDLKGITVGQVIGFNVTSQPLFIEVGGRLTYATGDNSKFMQVSVPVNATYKFTFSNELSIAPFAGLVAKGNILGETEAGGFKAKWFDEDGFDGNRFQAGWNIGVGANYKNFYLGVSYCADFIGLDQTARIFDLDGDCIYEETFSHDTSNYAITFGYTF